MSDRMDIRGAIGDGAARMSLPDLPQPEETQAILTGALRELEGIDTRLETWTADDHFTQFGKRLVVRYDLEARLAAAPNVRRYRWLGKFYDRDEDARRVASVLRELASFDGHAQSGLAFPSVLAYHAPRRLLLLTYESGESMTTAMAQDTEAILAAIGRALATLHSLPIAPTRILSPDAVLEDLRPRVRDLCDRFPSEDLEPWAEGLRDRKSTRLNSSHPSISYAVLCLKKKNLPRPPRPTAQPRRHPPR